MSEQSYALPLFALIDRSKVDPSKPIPDELADHLHAYLEKAFGIRALSAKIILLQEKALLVLQALDDSTLPALLALADVQKSELFRYEREADDTVILTPIGIDPGAADQLPRN
ncbi:MAG: hypothetical protein JJU20_00215 [Opitutales bacterium]|nr:hypothetical protein [Opitutales bacterium]